MRVFAPIGGMKKRDCPFVPLNIDAGSRTPRGVKPNRRLHNQHRGSAVCFRPQFIAWHPVASFAFSQKPIFSYVRSPTECHSFGGFVKRSVNAAPLKGQPTYLLLYFIFLIIMDAVVIIISLSVTKKIYISQAA